MNLLRHTDRDFAERRARLAAASSLFDPVIEERTRAILKEVQEGGDAALLELTRRFDGAELRVDQLAVSAAENSTRHCWRR
jgi:histidinol dehydrogenase